MKQLSKIVTLLAVFSTSQGALSQSFPQPPRVGVTEEAPKTKAQLTKELNEAIKLSQAGVAAYKSKNRDTISIYVRIDANNVSEKFMMLRYEAEEQGFTEIAESAEKWQEFQSDLLRAMVKFLINGNTEILRNML